MQDRSRTGPGANRRRALISLLALLLCLVACGAPSGRSGAPGATPTLAPTPTAQPTGLDVVRYSVYPENHVLPFQAHVRDAATVARLYADALSSLEAPPAHSCPVDIGASYQATFYQAGATVLLVTLYGGCEHLVVRNSDGSVISPPCRLSGGWSEELARAVGVAYLFDWHFLNEPAPPDGRFAPQPPTARPPGC